jgi:hypothetical protein
MHCNRIESRRRRTIGVVMLGAAAIASAVASASADEGGVRMIVMLDVDRITPSALTMKAGEVLAFQNYSGDLMKVVFVEPAEQADKIRCQLKNHASPRPDEAPWLVFDWGPGRQLTATIPPGRFASACTLEPGRYAFVTQPASRDPRVVTDSLGTKVTIAVE